MTVTCRNDDGVNVWHLLEDFQAHGAESGDGVRIVVFVEVEQAFLRRDLDGTLLTLSCERKGENTRMQ